MNAVSPGRGSGDEAAGEYLRRLHGPWSGADEAQHKDRLAVDTLYAEQITRADAAWRALDDYAGSPEGLAHREEAIRYARRQRARQWLRPHGSTFSAVRRAAGVAAIGLALAAAWQLSPWGYRSGHYRTGIGEQQVVELTDRSQLVIDAASRLTVRYADDARIITLDRGQAQFTVAKDPARPFKVRAGEYVVIALGTSFTVDYVNGTLNVAMVEGKVLVLSPAGSPVELVAGEQLRIDPEGQATVSSGVDMSRVLAWRQGKVVFQAESIEDAVMRMQRYSPVRIEVADEQLAKQKISGVFDVTDVEGLLAGIRQYYPLTISHTGTNVVTLRTKAGSIPGS